MSIVVNIAGLALIAFIVWWFWLAKKTKIVVLDASNVNVVVENGSYAPSYIELAAGVPIRFTFIRKDPAPCAKKSYFRNSV